MKHFVLLLLLALPYSFYAQKVAINADGSSADPSAMLDVQSDSKGLLIPRMTTADRQNISLPAEGLMVYDSTTASLWQYVQGAWTEMISTKSAVSRNLYKSFTHMIALNNTGSCPDGYDEELTTDFAYTANSAAVQINQYGTYAGGPASYNGEVNQMPVAPNGGTERICTKTVFGRKPIIAYQYLAQDSAELCPDGSTYLPIDKLTGQLGHHRIQTNDAGSYLGVWRDVGGSPAISSEQYQNGFLAMGTSLQTWHSGVCFKIYGSSDDDTHDKIYYPMFVAGDSSLQDSMALNGWHMAGISELTSGGAPTYLTFNDQTSLIAVISPSIGGSNYTRIGISEATVDMLYYKFQAFETRPFVDIRTSTLPDYQPADYACLDVNLLQGVSNARYIRQTGHGLFIGGVSVSSNHYDALEGARAITIQASTEKCCFRIRDGF